MSHARVINQVYTRLSQIVLEYLRMSIDTGSALNHYVRKGFTGIFLSRKLT